MQQVLAAAVPKYLDESALFGLPHLDVVEPIRRTMSADEEERLLKALPVDLRAIVIMGLDTLTRLSDILDVRRHDHHNFRKPEWYFPRRRIARTERDRCSAIAYALKPAFYRAAPNVPYDRARFGVTFHWGTRRTGVLPDGLPDDVQVDAEILVNQYVSHARDIEPRNSWRKILRGT